MAAMEQKTSSTRCADCGKEPHHPGSVARVVGRDQSGTVFALCTSCFIQRERDALIKPIGKTKKTK